MFSSHGIRLAIGVALPLALGACGASDEEAPIAPGSVCQSSSTVDGSVSIENQEQLDDLAGCETIRGDLQILPFESASLRALRSLRRVEGALVLGHVPTVQLPSGVMDYDLELLNLRGRGWVRSLEGLESLESVGSLDLRGVLARDLAPLERIRELTTGALHIASCNCEDLNGLRNVARVTRFSISDSELRDASAVRFADVMEWLEVQGAPIERLDAGNVRELGALRLVATELWNLDTFLSLETASSVFLMSNSELRSAEGLNGIQRLDYLSVVNNARLSRLANFDRATSVRSVRVNGNAVLQEVPTFPAVSASSDASTMLSADPARVSDYEISSNGALVRLVVPSAWRRVGRFGVEANEQLREIELGQLEVIDHLTIVGNSALTRVDVGVLEEVSDLVVMRNPLLSPGVFDSVPSFQRLVSDNAPSP